MKCRCTGRPRPAPSPTPACWKRAAARSRATWTSSRTTALCSSRSADCMPSISKAPARSPSPTGSTSCAGRSTPQRTPRASRCRQSTNGWSSEAIRVPPRSWLQRSSRRERAAPWCRSTRSGSTRRSDDSHPPCPPGSPTSARWRLPPPTGSPPICSWNRRCACAARFGSWRPRWGRTAPGRAASS